MTISFFLHCWLLGPMMMAPELVMAAPCQKKKKQRSKPEKINKKRERCVLVNTMESSGIFRKLQPDIETFDISHTYTQQTSGLSARNTGKCKHSRIATVPLQRTTFQVLIFAAGQKRLSPLVSTAWTGLLNRNRSIYKVVVKEGKIIFFIFY
ncbi:hypothetical protein FKM82_010249 [Ascaphus truei]